MFFFSCRVLTIMFISHLLATREVKTDQGTKANERGEVEDKKEVLRHCVIGKTTCKLKTNPQIMSIKCWTTPADLYSAPQACPEKNKCFPLHSHIKLKSGQQSFWLQSNHSYRKKAKGKFLFLFCLRAPVICFCAKFPKNCYGFLRPSPGAKLRCPNPHPPSRQTDFSRRKMGGSSSQQDHRL